MSISMNRVSKVAVVTASLLITLSFLASPALAVGDVPACTPNAREVADDTALTLPGFDKVERVEAGAPGSWKVVSGWAPDAKWTTHDTQKLKAQKPNRVRLVFVGGQQVCAQEVRLQGESLSETPIPLVEPQPRGERDFEGCRAAGVQWEAEIARQVAGTHYTVIVFVRSGEICHANRLNAPEGEPIYVGIYSEASDIWGPVEFAPCSLQDAAPAIFVGAGAVRLRSAVQSQGWSLLKVAPRTCFNENVAIKTSGTVGGTPAQIAFQFLQYRLYRATLQLGTVFTQQRGGEFGVVGDAGGQAVIHDGSATGRGPEYVVSLVIYGLPHYLYSLVGGPSYGGRDILHEQRWADRVGLVTGVGLAQPTRRFVLGASLEVMYGLNVLFVGEAFRRNQLDGVAVGDVFMGAASDIPTREAWQTRFVVGLSLDLRYVQEIFSGRVHP